MEKDLSTSSRKDQILTAMIGDEIILLHGLDFVSELGGKGGFPKLFLLALGHGDGLARHLVEVAFLGMCDLLGLGDLLELDVDGVVGLGGSTLGIGGAEELATGLLSGIEGMLGHVAAGGGVDPERVGHDSEGSAVSH